MAVIDSSNTLQFSANQTLSYGVAQSVKVPVVFSLKSIFAFSGNLLDQCNLLYSKQLTFAASTPQVLDLKNLLDPVGAAVAFSKIRLVAIRANSTTDGAVLLVGANGTNDWLGLSSTGSTITIYPSTATNDGFAIFQMPNSNGAAVGTTTKNLKLDPGTNAFTVDILIAGCA